MNLTNKMMKKLALTGAAVAALGTVAVSSNVFASDSNQAAQPPEQQMPPKFTVPETKLGMKEVVDKVVANYPNAKILEIKLDAHHDQSAVAYEVLLVDGETFRELHVDANTGEVKEDQHDEHGDHHHGPHGHGEQGRPDQHDGDFDNRHNRDDQEHEDHHHGPHHEMGREGCDAPGQGQSAPQQQAPQAQPAQPSGK